jgi:hypothetical protein
MMHFAAIREECGGANLWVAIAISNIEKNYEETLRFEDCSSYLYNVAKDSNAMR